MKVAKSLTSKKGDEVQRGESRLSSGRDKNESRLRRRVLLYGLKRRLVHRGHPRAVVLARKTGNVDLNRNWTNGRPEVEKPPAFRPDAEPVGLRSMF
jgi:hypothetical protein